MKSNCVYARRILLILPCMQIALSIGLIVLGMVYNHYFEDVLFWMLIMVFFLAGMFFLLYFAVWKLKFYDDKIEVRSMFGRTRVYCLKDRTVLHRNNQMVIPGIILKFGKRRIEIIGYHVNFEEFQKWLYEQSKDDFEVTWKNSQQPTQRRKKRKKMQESNRNEKVKKTRKKNEIK